MLQSWMPQQVYTLPHPILISAQILARIRSAGASLTPNEEGILIHGIRVSDPIIVFCISILRPMKTDQVTLVPGSELIQFESSCGA